MHRSATSVLIALTLALPAAAQDLPPTLPNLQYHLAPAPWSAGGTTNNDILDAVESLARFAAKHQHQDGAFIDPVLDREHQYATPYFAFAVGTLIHAGRAEDLRDNGVRAMDHSTSQFAKGNDAIPDQHGEFFLAPLAEALDLYEDHVEEEKLATWRERLSVPLLDVIEDIAAKTNNWRTYAMRGEWLRYKAGLVDRDPVDEFISDAWLNRTQRMRVVPTKWNLYQDWNGHPQSHAVEAVGRGNLLGLIAAGYDGPHHEEMERLITNATQTSLLLQDPTGQCPPNGRTDNHAFNDVLYMLIFDIMAERNATGDTALAQQYRRAANLAFDSIQRWQRHDGKWAGMYSITKNFFPPDERVGYQPASQVSNYSGATMFHLAEAYLARQTDLDESPALTEIGGYAFTNDKRFGSAVANAGGMQVFFNRLGDSVPKYGMYWTPLGVVRFSRAGWDSRLGPSDGAYDARERAGATFGPTWRDGPRWTRISEEARHYRGTFTVDFAHPCLVRCTILYSPVTGVGGPYFYHDFIITPDGVMTTLRCANNAEFGLTIPLIENDGRELVTHIGDRIISTRYHTALSDGSEQNFIILNDDADITPGDESYQSTYGWLRPIQVTSDDNEIHAFVYPRKEGEPLAIDVLNSFERTNNGYRSALHRVDGNIYIGRHSAGGVASQVDIDDDENPEITFNKECGFICKLQDRAITHIEADRNVTATIGDDTYELNAYEPLAIPAQ